MIAGLLSWYDESPGWLAAAVSGMARICDLVIAHDGAYALYPGGLARSHPRQAEAILMAAETAGIGCLLYRPKTIYNGNEVEKRAEGLRIANALLEPDEDWLIIWDADHHVMHCDPERVKRELAETHLDVATYAVLDGIDYLDDANMAPLAAELPVDSQWSIFVRAVFRWHPSISVGPAHHMFSDARLGERQWLRGPMNEVPLVEAHDLREGLVLYHRTKDRTRMRRESADIYYKRRDALEIESMVNA